MVEALYERVALVGYVSTSHGFVAASKQTATIDMDIFRRAIIILQGKVTGTVSTTHGGLTLTVWDSGATGTTPSTAIITCTGLQLTTTTRGYQAIAEVRSEQLNTVVSSAATYGRFIRARVLNGTLKAIANVIVLGGDCRYNPASDYDLSTVAEIKSS